MAKLLRTSGLSTRTRPVAMAPMASSAWPGTPILRTTKTSSGSSPERRSRFSDPDQQQVQVAGDQRHLGVSGYLTASYRAMELERPRVSVDDRALPVLGIADGDDPPCGIPAE